MSAENVEKNVNFTEMQSLILNKFMKRKIYVSVEFVDMLYPTVQI